MRSLGDVVERLTGEPTADVASEEEHREVGLPALREYNAIGRFESADASRSAVVGLEAGGIDGAQITVLPLHHAPVEPGESMREVDGQAVSSVAKSFVPGVLAGGTVGFLLGILMLAAASPVDVPTGVALMLAPIAVGAVVGAIISAYAHMAASRFWQESFDAEANAPILVAALVDEATVAEECAEKLLDAGALETWLLDAEGQDIIRFGRDD